MFPILFFYNIESKFYLLKSLFDWVNNNLNSSYFYDCQWFYDNKYVFPIRII